jgi:hypothetical protein
MKQNFSCFLSCIVVVLLFSCGTVQNQTPSRIGLSPLQNYSPAPGHFTTDTTFSVYKTSADFSGDFSPAAAEARHPDFNGQMVMAIVVRSAAQPALQFDRAEVAGKTINVYAQTCGSQKCPAGPALLATIPRVGDARAVRFFINGENRREVQL